MPFVLKNILLSVKVTISPAIISPFYYFISDFLKMAKLKLFLYIQPCLYNEAAVARYEILSCNRCEILFDNRV